MNNNIRPRFGTSAPLAAATRVAGGLAMALWLATPAAAALPPAGSIIGNQASASYTDESGQTKSATSNLVETTVQQVGVFTLVQDNTKTAAVGNTVYMAHTLTNTGNGSDTFKLTLGDNAGTFTATNLAIYADANGDGVPDNTTALCVGVGAGVGKCTDYVTPGLPANGTFKFVVSMTVPASAENDDSDNITVTATPGTAGLYTTATRSNTDTLNVTSAASFQVNKSISATQGGTGGTLTYTLTYKNVGAAAGNLVLQDVIGSGSTVGYEYVTEDKARWSAGNSQLFDNALVAATPDANIGGMDAYYEAISDVTGKITTIKANINKVGPNVTGTVSFQVKVLATALPGTSTTTNTAYFAVDDDFNPTTPPAAPLQPTNPSLYNVLSSYSVVLNDGTLAAADGNGNRPANGDDDSTSNKDLSYFAAASPGQTITFSNTVWNTGNSTDTFNITAAGMAAQAPGSAWPTGTTFQLFKSDGSSPLLDSNGDGVPDTGAMTAASSYTVILKVTLPTSACPVVSGVITCPTGPFDVENIATSVGNPAVSNKTYDRLAALTAPTVDLDNSTGSFDTGSNEDPVTAVTITHADVLPGQTTTFDLFVRNEGLINDTYGLAYSGTNAFAPATALPAGWTVQFRAGACTDLGSVITSVAVSASVEKKVCAVVTVPASALAGTTNVYFQVLSQVTGAFDATWDAVTVKSINSLTLAPSGTGQVSPGGTIVYPHTVTNTGNTSCGTSFDFTISNSLLAQGWTFVLYRDINGNGVIDGGDTAISPETVSTTLAPAAQFKILVKVFAPAGAAAATTDVTSLYVSSTCDTTATATTSNTATDTTTVVTGQIRLVKTQVRDAACTGTVTAGFVSTPLTAKPGECISYQVVATNEGLGAVTDLTISDSLPSFTTAMPLAAPVTACSAGTAAYASATSLFSCSGLTLPPSISATMTFSVKVNGVAAIAPP